jgi:hypothetical protein
MNPTVWTEGSLATAGYASLGLALALCPLLLVTAVSARRLLLAGSGRYPFPPVVLAFLLPFSLALWVPVGAALLHGEPYWTSAPWAQFGRSALYTILGFGALFALICVSLWALYLVARLVGFAMEAREERAYNVSWDEGDRLREEEEEEEEDRLLACLGALTCEEPTNLFAGGVYRLRRRLLRERLNRVRARLLYAEDFMHDDVLLYHAAPPTRSGEEPPGPRYRPG